MAHGFVKVLTAPGKDRILGATIVGERAGELLAEFVLAMKQGLGLNKILATIHACPTLAEVNKYVADNWRPSHTPARWPGLSASTRGGAVGVVATSPRVRGRDADPPAQFRIGSGGRR